MPVKDVRTVYCSGAVFCPEEVKAMEEIARALEDAGYSTYLPHRDGMEAFVLNAVNNPLANLLVFRPIIRFLSKATFALDIFQILESDYFVFNMNGRVPDDGGAFVAAVAFTVGKPVVLYKRDHRTKLHGNDNAMISGLSFDFSPVREPSRIPDEVARAMGRCRESRCGPGGMPPSVKINVDLGREVWESLQRFKAPGSTAGPMDFYNELAEACEASEAYRLRARPTI